MNIKLADNIRNFRKDRRLTQEQLAEALGVTVGAVYKWENERSTPEVNLLIEMADLFETSMDALLGYKVRNNDREHILERLKTFVHDRNAANAISEAEKALKKYPNNFDVVYWSAHLFDVRGTECRNEQYLRRALELFQYACLLIDQNTDDTISILYIQIHIAEIYSQLGKTDKSVEILKKNNPCRINSARIGEYLAAGCNRPTDAIPYLSEALLDCVVNQIKITTGYVNVFLKENNYQSAIDILHWLLESFPRLKIAENPNFFNKTEALFLLLCGELYLRLEQPVHAKDYIRQAKVIAQAFDAAPNYSTDSIRFVVHDNKRSGHDNLGNTAMEALQHFVDEEDYPDFTTLWEDIKNEPI